MKFMTSFALCVLTLALFSVQNTAAQNLPATATGKKFILTFPSPVTNTYDARFPSVILNREANTVLLYSDHLTTVQIASNGTGWSETVALVPGEFKEVSLPIGQGSYVEAGGISHNAYTVRSRRPILVYCYMVTAFGSEAWTPLPVESWGKEYYVSAVPAETVQDIEPAGEFNYNTTVKGAPSQLIITAAQNSTTVVISPKDAVVGSGLGSITVTLNAGQSYMVRSEVNRFDPDGLNGPDLGGTKIISNKIIGVTSGNTRASATEINALSRNSFKGTMLEALAPVQQHGTEFVYTPTWDAQRMRDNQEPVENDGRRRAEFTRVYGTSSGKTYGTVSDNNGGTTRFDVLNSQYHSIRFASPTTGPTPHVIRTDQPSQAMMHSTSVVKFNGTVIFGNNNNYIGASYSSWTPYMVELTPREQWTNVAAFYLPGNPSGINNYINIVAPAQDQNDIYIQQQESPAQLISFNQGAIPGSDLVWGSMQVAQGITYRIFSTNEARFTGHIYANWAGMELHRPGSTKKDDDGKSNSIQAVHPSEYEEEAGVALGYPLTPLRKVLADSDHLSISQEAGNNGYYHVTITGSNPTGIRSIDLSPESVNAEIEVLEVDEDTDVVGLTEASVRVYPIDPELNASATLVVTDRTGAETTSSYEYTSSVSSVENRTRATGSLRILSSNPTTGRSVISLLIAHDAQTHVVITDVRGKEVHVLANQKMRAGEHLFEWDATELPAGMYFCTVTSGTYKAVQRIVVQ